jgi:hypothetical protein
MCLWVGKSFVKNPIVEMEGAKELSYMNGKWVTPYQQSELVPGTGWFMPVKPDTRRSEFSMWSQVSGGYLHVFSTQNRSDRNVARKYRTELPDQPRHDRSYTFLCYARDVVAFDSSETEFVCKALYIPAFDLTGAHRHAQIKYT